MSLKKKAIFSVKIQIINPIKYPICPLKIWVSRDIISRSLSKFLRENPVTVAGIPTGSAVSPGSLLLCLVDIWLGCA